MFKIPSWEDDVPKSTVDFGKSNKNKKEKKSVEGIKSPKSPTKQQHHAKPVENLKKKKKKNVNLSKNKSPAFQPSVNGIAKSKYQGNNSITLKSNKTKLKNTNLLDQHQNPPKNSTYVNVQPQLNGNPKQAGHIQSKPTLKNKKKRSKKRKIKQQESLANDTQEENKFDDTIDISNPSKPKKRKHITNNNDTDPVTPSKKKKKGNQSDEAETDVNLPIHATKVDKKKEMFRKLLQEANNRNTINVSGNKLRERMLERLKAAQFRFLNEKLYTTSGSEAQKLFQSDPEAFHTYHQGYQQQLKKWPVNPLDLIVKRISKMPKSHIIADMGCGEAALSKRIQQSVRSFDLVASVPGVEACDMAHTPLLSESVDVAVYCLALMGTELTQYLVEANRVLKVGGSLLIAEVESRFEKVETFTDCVQRLGFKLKNLDKSHQVFYFMEFTKLRGPPAKKSKLPALTLKPCLYKKR